MSDDKYIVFRNTNSEYYHRDAAIEDAVVIRRQDVFAGPALHAYGHSIALVAKLLQANGNGHEAVPLQRIADYFHEQALLADAEGYKVPD